MTAVANPTRIEFAVRGTPEARPRPRVRAVKGKGGRWVGQMYQPKGPGKKDDSHARAWRRAHEWAQAVRGACIGKMPPEPWTGPVRLEVDIFFPRPQYMLKQKYPDTQIRHTAKPDRDNLDKAVMDALVEARLFADDAQVCDGAVRKWYSSRGCDPGVIIVAERILEEGALFQ